MLKQLTAAAFLTAAMLIPAKAGKIETAVFAGGCFWCVESDMDHVKGVVSTTSGYAGGTMENPTYENHDGYVEAVKVEFDPDVVPYDHLVATFLRTIDVTDPNGQFCDQGSSYKTAIFATSAAQTKAAQKAVADAEKVIGQTLATPVRAFTTFSPAEMYHQDYYQGQNRTLTRFGYVKQSEAYAGYREGCGRDQRVRQVWGDMAFEGMAGH